jgi:hypothetical protein
MSLQTCAEASKGNDMIKAAHTWMVVFMLFSSTEN